MSASKAEKRAILLMVICSFFWSIAGIFIKLIPWNPLVIAGWRSLLSAGCVVIYMHMSGMKIRFNKSSAISGMFLGLTLVSIVVATKVTTAANAIVLQFTAPVFILVLSALVFHQRFSRADIYAVIFTMLGISLFFFDQLKPGSMFGNCVAIFSGFCLGCMYVNTERSGEGDRMSGIFFGHVFASLVGIPCTFVFDTPVTVSAVLSILVLGIIQLGIPYILYGIAVKDCPALVCSLISAIEPLLNPFWVFLFAGETPGIFALIGGAAVIATITIWCVWRGRHAVKETPPEEVEVP